MLATAGCGERRATSSSIWRFDLPAASASTLADAEGEHRGERPIKVELPLVDLAEVHEKRRVNPV
jgi:hypothetical protein